jgi:DsbC/DsbD-like thiol-disulfide interchange protein
MNSSRDFSRLLASSLILLCAAAAFAQSTSPAVSVAPVNTIVVSRGSKAPLKLTLQVNRGFHINSNQPNDEMLVPTVVHLDPPQGITIVDVKYPVGEQLALPIMGNDKLSVYSGSFVVTAEVRIPASAPLGTQRVHGEVRFQACDNRQCFPPKTTPLEFDVKVVRPKVKKSTYTAASPHIQ